MKFRKKPMEVEAIQWTGKNTREVKKWMEQVGPHPTSHTIAYFIPRRSTGMTETLWLNVADENWSEGITAAVYDYLHETYVGLKDGDWIIQGARGEFYPHDATLFKTAYETVEDTP